MVAATGFVMMAIVLAGFVYYSCKLVWETYDERRREKLKRKSWNMH